MNQCLLKLLFIAILVYFPNQDAYLHNNQYHKIPLLINNTRSNKLCIFKKNKINKRDIIKIIRQN